MKRGSAKNSKKSAPVFDLNSQDWPSLPSPPVPARVPTFQGPGTFVWEGSAGGYGNPMVVWQFAETEAKAIELILLKTSTLHKGTPAEEDGHIVPISRPTLSDDPSAFGIVFEGCFTQIPRVDQMREILDAPPSQMVKSNQGSGVSSCLDG